MDSETFSKLYRLAYPRLVVIAAALVQDRDEACDVVQQSALVAIEKIEQFAPSHEFNLELEFARWMAAIVRNVAANVRRKQRVRRALPLDENCATTENSCRRQSTSPKHEEIGFDHSTRTFLGISEAFDDQLRSALRSLSEISHICLLLHVVLHLTLDEIGQLLDIPAGTAASHISRAKKSLRDRLHDYRGPAT